MRIPDVILVGPILDISGTSEVARNLYFALSRLGVKVKLVDLPYWSHLKADLHPEVNDEIQHGLNRNDIHDPVAIHFYPPDPFRGIVNVGTKYNISYTVFETDKCPILWRDMLNNNFNEIWVACDFHKEAYASQGVDRNKIKVINFGVDSTRFNPNVQPLEIADRPEFLFGTSMDWSVRKNPEGILAAFMQEFSNEPNVGLLFKAYTGYGDKAAAEGIKNEIKKMRSMFRSKANVLYSSSYLHADNVPSLHNTVDAWINLSRGEGWDLGSIQSIACGKPVVYSDNTSHKVYLNSNSSYPVSCAKTPITSQEFLSKNPQFLGHSWYEPNTKDARKQLRQVYNDFKSGAIKEKQEAARQRALDFPWQRTATRMLYQLFKFQ